MTDELGGKVMKKFLGSRAETYSYLINDGSEDKKAKRIKAQKENLSLKITKTVQKQCNLRIK